ncbi:MAG: S9 family peptidase [Acidobacteriota bacterium]|nr:S9 family peptidase [Acidobacteriota bacterium]
MIIYRTFVVIALTVIVSMLLVAQTTIALQSEAPQEENRRLMTAWDTQNFITVGSPRISPDDQWVLYTQSVRDWDDDELDRATHIWRVRTDGTDRRRLTFGESDTGSPAWFPDGGKIAFASGRAEGEETQIFSMYVDGGEAWQVTEHEGGVSQFSIAPDGEKILFTARDPLSEEQARRKKIHDDAEVVDESFQMTHLWFFDIDSGESKRLTSGDFTISDPQWAPDSSKIAYVTRPTPKVDDSSWSDVWVVDLEGNAELFFENAGPDTSPRWSPDGNTLAMASKPQPGNTQWYSKLHLFPADGGEPIIMLDDFDLAFGQPMWARDGRTIYWSTGQGTVTNLFGVDLDSGELTIRRAPMRGANGQWQLSHDGNFWVFSHSDPGRPGNLWVATREGDGFGPAVQLTDANPWVEQEEVQLGRVESVRWTNSDGGTIEGVLTYPADFHEGTRYPLIVNPHGGPSGASMESFSSTNHMFAGNGFLVLQINFRGSSNYGQEHLNANQDNWGIRDYDDIMTGVDYVTEQGWADPDRMVAYGWSYGGYMTFWMSTQTDRFKLISPGAGLSNLYSMYSTTDIPAYLGWFFGTPWDNEDIYRQLSPIRHAHKVTARILIMHGANDERVPPEQAVEFYKALTDLGKDVSFVRYPRQGHGISEPRLAMDRLRRYVCAFTDVLGMEATTEQCDGGVPMVDTGDGENMDDKGMTEVGLPESAVDIELLHGEGLDCGIFEVNCYLKDE